MRNLFLSGLLLSPHAFAGDIEHVVVKEPAPKQQVLGASVVRDGKCYRSGVYNPQGVTMDNCKPTLKKKTGCSALDANCIF